MKGSISEKIYQITHMVGPCQGGISLKKYCFSTRPIGWWKGLSSISPYSPKIYGILKKFHFREIKKKNIDAKKKKNSDASFND